MKVWFAIIAAFIFPFFTFTNKNPEAPAGLIAIFAILFGVGQIFIFGNRGGQSSGSEETTEKNIESASVTPNSNIELVTVENKELYDENSEQGIMNKYGIIYSDEKYIYKEYRYDKLDDAINYAKKQFRSRGINMMDLSLSETPHHVKPNSNIELVAEVNKEIHDNSEQEMMNKYGIVYSDEKYIYKEYRYDKLHDAINYAKKQS